MHQENLPLESTKIPLKKFIKQVAVVSIVIFLIGTVLSLLIGSDGTYASVQKDRQQIETAIKNLKEQISDKSIEVDEAAKIHAQKIEEFKTLAASLDELREAREANAQSVNAWINEGFDLSR